MLISGKVTLNYGIKKAAFRQLYIIKQKVYIFLRLNVTAFLLFKFITRSP
jgi:hypothetical protein